MRLKEDKVEADSCRMKQASMGIDCLGLSSPKTETGGTKNLEVEEKAQRPNLIRTNSKSVVHLCDRD